MASSPKAHRGFALSCKSATAIRQAHPELRLSNSGRAFGRKSIIWHQSHLAGGPKNKSTATYQNKNQTDIQPKTDVQQRVSRMKTIIHKNIRKMVLRDELVQEYHRLLKTDFDEEQEEYPSWKTHQQMEGVVTSIHCIRKCKITAQRKCNTFNEIYRF